NTKRALTHIPGIKTAFFSILPPNTKIPPHYGPYNGVLRYHLGVKIPKAAKSCGIKVKNEKRYWIAGKSLIFDDSYKHEAWNYSSETRVVLFVDFIRPMHKPFKWLNELFYEHITEQKFNVKFKENVIKNKGIT
ncbi:TPA: aspartyl/asparaginyl beta-hydroxylase domain-containing protein, partial [Vibrio cholerae]|nr:aspartyl/asparaginyl beta-hydroxylase domain-containing protein [Vibrio cholerae]